ncbi:MAG: hypothetical protein AAFV88_04335 [Planctomycetota bacterium]
MTTQTQTLEKGTTMYSMPLNPRVSQGNYTGGGADRRPDAKYAGHRTSDTMSSSGAYLGGVVTASRSPDEEEKFLEMMKPPKLKYDGDQHRLFQSVQRSYRSLRGYRETLTKLIEDYAGTHYHQEDRQENNTNRYVNLLLQAVEAYQMLLVADQPRVMISTKLPQYRGFARHFQQALNALVKEIHLDETLEKWVMDAFFGLGVIKTHMADAGVVEIETDLWMDPGRPFASNIALDDFVYDMQATKWSEVRYAGDMYRLAWDDAIELFGEDALEEHHPSSRTGLDGDRVEQVSRSTEADNDDLEDMVDLIDLWLPRHGVIYTYVVGNRREMRLDGDPIAIEEWTGDEQGPYHLLGFHDVPENIMPSSPAANLEILESLINDLMRKGARQARRQKDITLYNAAGVEAAQNIINADDGESINVNDTSDVGQMKLGGVDPGNHAFMIGSMEIFDRMAGNLQAHLGLGSQAATLGQEQLVHGAAGQKVDKMQKRVVGCTVRLMKALGLMLWDDPVKEIVNEIPIEGTSFRVESVWKPNDREGKFIDYNLDIDVYSMQYQSPQTKLQKINELVQGVLVPLSPILQQQGGMIDLFELTRMYAEMLNIPELREIVKFTGIPGDTTSPAIAQVPTKPPTSTRNYVRTNVSAGQTIPMAQSSQMMNQAAAAGPPMGGMPQ